MKKNIDALVIGLALFSIFFGAGNLIFPPYLGMASCGEWITGFIVYFIFDIGLALVGIYAIMKNGGEMSKITEKIGKIPSFIICTILVLCIGPLFVVPRTAATTFEMLVNIDFLPENSKFIFSLIYFAIVILLTIRPSKVIDIVGKVLTPILFASLAFLIIYGIVNPLGAINDTAMIENVVKEGVTTGYQTMDVFGGILLAGIIIDAVVRKGYKDKKSQGIVTFKSCIIASTLLLFVYGGLTYLGATASTIYSLDCDRTLLLVAITEGLLGKVGAIALSIVVSLACITTAIGFTSSCADYFHDIYNKVSYKTIVYISSIVGIIIANLGLDTIISLASPVLNLTYPIVLTMICLSLSVKHQNKFVNYGAVIAAISVSFLNMLNSLGITISYVKMLPLYDYDLYWIIPAILGGTIGGIIGEIAKASHLKPTGRNIKALK